MAVDTLPRAINEHGKEEFLADILDRNTVHVWCLETEKLRDHEMSSASALLSSEERARQNRLYFPEDRRDFVAAHALLRRSLSIYSNISPNDWHFKATATGKPAVLQPVLQVGHRRQESFGFSLSHTRGLVACAIGAPLAVGIDVERLDRKVDIDAIAPLCLSSSELDALRRSPAPERQTRFIELWVLKEAFLKAAGKDLSSLKESSFALREDGGIELVSRSIDGAGWHFELSRLPRHRLAVAVKCSSAKVLARWTDIGKVLTTN